MQNNEIQNIEVKSLPITLTQFLKWCGAVLTGGQAKEMIHAGMVSLNGSVCEKAGQKLQPGDVVGIEQQEFKLVLSEN